MSTAIILFTTLTVLVVVQARFIGPPLLPVPMDAPFHPPMVAPIIRPFIHPIAPPVIPIVRQSRVTSGLQTRPRSRPFVMEERDFFPMERDPVIIKIVERPDPIREVMVIENKQPVVIERPRYLEDGTGDISIDGNVYISDPFAANDLKAGASMDQVVSRAVGSGQLSTGDNFGVRGDLDYPLPRVNVNLQTRPIEPLNDNIPLTLI